MSDRKLEIKIILWAMDAADWGSGWHRALQAELDAIRAGE